MILGYYNHNPIGHMKDLFMNKKTMASTALSTADSPKQSSWLTRHIDSVNESYFRHMFLAMGFAITMALGAVACLVHAFLPFLFEKTGSNCIRKLHDRMVINRDKLTR